MEDERDDEAGEEERDDQDEEEDDEGDTDSVKTYVKNTIRFDDDDERNPHATSSPKGNITIMLHIFLTNVMLASMKYNIFHLCKLQLFANYYCNPNRLKMSRQTNGFNLNYIQTK